MSRLEDLLWEAEKLGVRREVLNRVGEIRVLNPKMDINEVYDRAYTEVTPRSRPLSCSGTALRWSRSGRTIVGVATQSGSV